MFGLSHPEVCRLIQELPGAELCKNFRPELSFSRFGPQVVARPTGEELSLLVHSDNMHTGEMDHVLGRRPTLPSSDFEVEEGGSGKDEIPLALWHVKAVEPRRGKTLLRSPTSQQYHANQSTEYDEGDEEEDEEENDEDNNEDGESTDDDD
jgi:hypothetical protein